MVTTNDKIEELLRILDEELIPWTETDVEHSLDSEAHEQAKSDVRRLNNLKIARKFIDGAKR